MTLSLGDEYRPSSVLHIKSGAREAHKFNFTVCAKKSKSDRFAVISTADKYYLYYLHSACIKIYWCSNDLKEKILAE